MERPVHSQIQINCIKLDEYLRTLQKALHFDEDYVNSFQNTYNEIINDAIEANWNNHRIAEDMSITVFKENLKQQQN